MPFIACLNNVKTTHAPTCTRASYERNTTSPPPNQRDEPAHTTQLRNRQGKAGHAYSQPDTPQGTPPTIEAHPKKQHLVAKMLASTMQISNNNPTNTPHPPEGEHGAKGGPETPTTPPPPIPTGTRHPPHPHRDTTNRRHAADPSGPNSVLDPTPDQRRAASTHNMTDKLPHERRRFH